MADNLTEEDVFNNDIDPLEGIRQLRKEEEEEDGNLSSEDDFEVKNETTEEEKEEEEEEIKSSENDNSLKEDEETSEENDTAEDSFSSDDEEESKTDHEESVDKTAEGFNLEEKRKFKANGQEFEFSVQEMLDQFGTVFAQSMDYTKKTQKIAPYRKMISALEEENITAEQLNVAIDALKGNKGAIKQLMDSHNIESYDLSENEDDRNPYKPTEYGADEQTLNLQEVVNNISQDEEYPSTVNIVQHQWDQTSQNKLANNPQLLQGLHNDVKTGVYAKVAPEAIKLKVLDGNTKSDIEYYMLAGQQLSQQREANSAKNNVDELNKKTQDAVTKADQASSEANKKRSASSTGSRSDRTVIDYLDDDDEAFDDWYKKVTSSQ